MKEKIGLAPLEHTSRSLLSFNAYLNFYYVDNIDLACFFRPLLPVLAMAAQFPAISIPGRLPAIDVVA